MKEMKKTEEKSTNFVSKIVILGGRNVGKSALAVRFLTKRFIGDYRSDTDMLYKCSAKIDGSAQSVEILDTSSDSDVTEVHLQWADAFILVYSIIDKDSFEWVNHMMKILSSKRPSTPILVVGAKSDLQHLKEVQELDGRCLALNHGSRFQELSSAEGYNSIVETFESFLKEVRCLLQKGRNSGDISPPKSNKCSKFHFGAAKSTGELWPPKQKKNSLGRMLGSLIGKSPSPQVPITQLIVLDRNEFCKSKAPIRYL